MGGLSIISPPSSASPSRLHAHRAFLLCSCILLGAASACIFLTLSLRLVPSTSGLLLILLHALTVAGAVCGCAAPSSGSVKWHAAHMAATVLTAIFQGAVALVVFTRTGDFLGELRSYVREEDGVVILKMVGGLGAAIFCLEWAALALAFALRYYAYLEGGDGDAAGRSSAKVRGQEEESKDWSWAFHV